MSIRAYHVDAFTSRVFSGNPALVCPLEEWLDDAVLQAIAREKNLSETAFLVNEDDGPRIRWFTPTQEIDLCGHATLAAAFVFFTYLEPSRTRMVFRSHSGELVVRREGGLLVMDFPSRPPAPCPAPRELREGLGRDLSEVWCAEDYLAVFPEERDVIGLRPDMHRLGMLDRRGVIVTAEGEEADFVSRFFAPKFGIPEDPVTGSAHCSLIPYWSQRLDKKKLRAQQRSERGGELFCTDAGDRVLIAGRAVTFMEGTISIPPVRRPRSGSGP